MVSSLGGIFSFTQEEHYLRAPVMTNKPRPLPLRETASRRTVCESGLLLRGCKMAWGRCFMRNNDKDDLVRIFYLINQYRLILCRCHPVWLGLSSVSERCWTFILLVDFALAMSANPPLVFLPLRRSIFKQQQKSGCRLWYILLILGVVRVW